jgi:hypothetical protein
VPVLLAYVDESASRHHYYIAALLCPGGSLQGLAAALDDVVAKAAGAHPGIESSAELHGYELFHGKGDWATLKSKVRARAGIRSVPS